MRQFRRLVAERDAILVAVENGEDRSEQTLELLHALGVEDGMADLALLLPDRRVRLIEVKLEATLNHGRTDLTDAQREMHAKLARLGHQVEVIRNWDEFWAIVIEERVPHRPPPARAEQLVLWQTGSRTRARARD